jgi:hypothetical protein
MGPLNSLASDPSSEVGVNRARSGAEAHGDDSESTYDVAAGQGSMPEFGPVFARFASDLKREAERPASVTLTNRETARG